MQVRIFKMVYILSFILFNIFLCSEITTEQLQKIKEVTEDVNTASDFTLKTVQDDFPEIYSLSDMKNKVILINFWATWCGPCRLEIPDFNELYDKYHEKGFEILSISISDTKEQLVNFLKAYKIDYPLLYGSPSEIQKVVSNYGGVYSIPMSFLIGLDNKILRIYPGAILKQYDPNMFADLVYNIENSILELNKKNSSELNIDK
tara:strand:+ start:176 stop:787 length:612 start_codon:yes stop_codon:yes gene_type:complete